MTEWAKRYGLVAGITTRDHGLSFELWNAEPVAEVMGRWGAFRAGFASRFPAIVLSHQVHGTEVRWHQGLPPGWLLLDGLDGHATADQGVMLAVTVADCVPVYLAVPENGIALVHAGWRGVAGGVLARAARLLRERTSSPVSQIVMHCGVSICSECYEVGSEVAQQLTGAPAQGHVKVDLRALLTRQANALGIEQVTVSPWCSAHDRDRFFSHRASQGRDGRMLAYLGIPLA